MPDTRGTGESADASDPLSYRCDRLAGDVEALRAHLGLDRMDLLGDSAAGDLATLYAAAYGRWDNAAQAHVDAGVSERSRPVRDGFRAEGAFNPSQTREAVSRLTAPVLVYAGELDAAPTPQTAAAGARWFPERYGDRPARGRALPMARRPGLLHRRNHLIPELSGVVIDVPATG